MKVSVIIPTYNAQGLLEKNLPYLIKALDSYDSEVVIVDNGSTDKTSDWIKINYPNIQLVKLEKNYGFVKATNQGVEESKGDLLLFLNNDIQTSPHFLKPLLDDLGSDVFSVSSLQEIVSGKGRFLSGASYGFFKNGFLKHDSLFKKQKEINEKCETFYPAGGTVLVDRKKFLELGGFSVLYAPFYWEDADLGLRAWRRGWKSLFEPKSEVIHEHESTARKLNKNYVRLIADRNKIIFNWLHLPPKMLLVHILFLPFNALNELRKLNWVFPFSLGFALLKSPAIIIERVRLRKTEKIKTEEILNKWKEAWK